MKKPLASESSAGIDLHIHSTASDGTLTPSEILVKAVTLGLKAIAITDHDTLSGSEDALARGIPPSLEFLTGIEISAAAPDGYPLNGSVHVLGYGIDPSNPGLLDVLQIAQQAREERTPKIIKRLKALGMVLEERELSRIVGSAMVGRPHIARLMMEKKMVTSIDDAFDRFLGKNKPAYVQKYRIPMTDTIDAINGAGGIAVLAHPHVNGLKDAKVRENFILDLQSKGLKGIEAIYPDHPQWATEEYCLLARKHDLLITGGTDFHGAVTPNLEMGVGNGSFHVPYHLYESLIARLKR